MLAAADHSTSLTHCEFATETCYETGSGSEKLVNAWLAMYFAGTCCWCNGVTMGGCGMKKRERWVYLA